MDSKISANIPKTPTTERKEKPSTRTPKSPRPGPANNPASQHIANTLAQGQNQAATSNPRTDAPVNVTVQFGMDGAPAWPIAQEAVSTLASEAAPTTASSVGAELVKNAQEQIAAGNLNGACAALNLPNLCAAAPDIITVGYENDLAYTDHFFNYNRPHLEQAPQDFIVVLDGLPEMAKSDGYKNCKNVPASLQNIAGLQIVGLSTSSSTQLFSNLQHSCDALKTVSTSYAASKERLQPTWFAAGSAGSRADLAELKSSRSQLLRDIETNLALHQIEGSFTEKEDIDLLQSLIKLTQKNSTSATGELSKGLNTLALSAMKKNKAASMKEEFSEDLQSARAGQIAQLIEENPGTTIIVRCGALMLHSTEDEKTGEIQTGFIEPLLRGKDGQRDDGVLSLVMVRNNQKADMPVNHRTISMKVGDVQKVATTDKCIAIDYTLLRTAVESEKHG